MFPSSTPFSHNQSMNTSGNPSSSIHDQEININPSPLIFDFPAPFLGNDHDQYHFLLSELNHLLSQQQQQQQQHIQGSKSRELVMDGQHVATNVSTSSGNKKSSGKRRGKKDRHSKIYTAQGPRDRRIRLSLPIARKFFDLQDMLGVDKASKTIDWLFSQSKAAVKDLTTFVTVVGGGKSVSSTSESEVTSIAKMCSSTTLDIELDKEEQVGDVESSGNVVGEEEEKKKMKSKKVVKQGVVQLLQTRELRDKARARARERTMEKLMKNKRVLGSCGSQELVNEAPSHDELLGHQMASSVNIMERLLGTTTNPSSILKGSTTGISRSAGTKSKDIVVPENWGIYNDSYYCAFTNTKTSPGNADHLHQIENPSAVFVTNQNGQQQRRVSTLEQNPGTISQEQNPNSALYPNFSEQNPAGYYPGLTSSEIFFPF